MDERGNSELVRELVEGFNAGDREPVIALLSEDAEIRTIRSELEGRPYVGPDGMRQALEDWDKEWDFVRFTAGDTHERDRFVVQDLRVQAKGKASGVELDVPIWMLWEFEGDRIVRIRSYSQREAALEEAGIPA